MKDELREWKNGDKVWNGLPVTPDSDEEKQEDPGPMNPSDKDLYHVGIEIK